MTDKKQPEALRLAAWLKAGGFINMTIDDTVAIVNELVTQHEQITELQAREPVFQWTGTEADDAMLLLARMDDRLDPERIAQLEKIIPRLAGRMAELEARNALINEMNGQLREQNETVGMACAELEAENRTLKEQHEAIGAGGVTGLQTPNYWRRWSAAQVERLYRNSEVARNDTKSLAAFRRVVTLVEEAHFLPPAIAQEGGKS